MDDQRDSLEDSSEVTNLTDSEQLGESPDENLSEEPPVPPTMPRRKLLRLPKPKTFLVGFTILLSLSLAVSANLQAFLHTHTYTAQDVLADGYLDQDFSLLNVTADDTYFKAHESVRTVVIFYAAASDPKTVLGSFPVPGVVVSEKYVIVTSEVLPPEGYVLVGALMVSTEYDREMKIETLVDVKAPSSKYQIVAFGRPEEDTKDTPKLDVPSLALVRPDDLTGGNALLAVPTDLLIQNGVLTPAPLRGSVVYAVKGTPAIIATGVAIGQPVFALRDGVPEFVGIATSVSEQSVIVTTADAIKQYLDFIELGN